MPKEILDIRNIEDLEKIEQAILENRDFELGEIEPIPFKLKLDGGRFENYNVKFIDKFVAEIILIQQNNYEKLLKEIEKLYDVKIPEEARILKFELEQGSLDIEAVLKAITEVIKTMSPEYQLYSIIIIVGGIVTFKGFSSYLEYKKHKLEIKSKEVSERLSGEEQERYLDTINKSIDALKEVSNNAIIQKAINTPKKEIANKLKDDETLSINNNDSELITKNDVSRFEYIAPVATDIEEEVIEESYIDNYKFRSEDKLFKISGISKEADSLSISPEKRIKLITKAEAGEKVKLKIKTIKDGLTNAIKKVMILDYIEN